MCALMKLLKDQIGVTAIEYALIAALIAVAAIAAFTLVGTRLSTTFRTIAGKLSESENTEYLPSHIVRVGSDHHYSASTQGGAVQILWSVTAIGSILAILFIITRG
jgi:pilus assembly protein Flp/PilA